MNCTLTLTLPDGTNVTANLSPKQPYDYFSLCGLGVWYVPTEGADEFALHFAHGGIDTRGRAIGAGFDFQRLRIEFDQHVESLDGRCLRSSGTSQVVIEAAAKPHYWPFGSQTVRRFLWAGGAARRAQRRTEVDSGPLKSRWPTFPTSPGFYARKRARLIQAILSGHKDEGVEIKRDRVGVFFPDGPERPDEPGGERIFFHWGYEPDDAAAWIHRQMVDLSIDRERTACFDLETGRQLTVEDWITRRGSVPDYLETQAMLTEPDSSVSPEKPILNSGVRNYDGEHRIRAYGHAIAAWAQYRDPIAQRFLIQLAEHARGARLARSLPARITEATQRPATASANLGRHAGWIWFLMSVARWAGDASQGIYDCGERFRKLYELSAMSNGFASRNTAGSASGGITSPWDNGLWPKSADHLQSLEVWILHNAAFAWNVSTRPGFELPPNRLMRLLGRIPLSAKLMLKATDSLLRNPQLPMFRYFWSQYAWGPPHYVVCANANGQPHKPVHMGGAILEPSELAKHPEKKTWIGDATHVSHGCALAYRMSGDPVYRELLKDVDLRTDTLDQKRALMLKSFTQEQGESDYDYANGEQSRAWNVEALSVLG